MLVSRLDYPNFRMRRDHQQHAGLRSSGNRSRTTVARSANASKFINAEKVQGFKAGAATHRDGPHGRGRAEIIGIIDADYVVQPDWLKDLVPVFTDPRVGLVQAPQDHRDGGTTLMHYIMNGEYAGFFDIGMVQRNEANAIIVHGTMCLVRRAAMEMAGGWNGDTICEDTDLGLAIIEHGWLTHYTNHRYGHGLLPDTYRGLQEAAPSLGLWRPSRSSRSTGGVFFRVCESRLTPDQRRRICAGVAELAGGRKPWRGGCHP